MASRKTALVTGTSQGGIGDALAQELHSKGFRVFAAARDLTKVQHLADMGLDVVLLDVVDSASIDAAVAEVKKATGGRLDMLINNSGINIAKARAMFDVNVFGLLELTQKLSPLLINAKGTVINIGSVVGELPFPFMGMYCASKAALEMISRAMQLEYAAFDVKVIHVVSGGVKTDLFRKGKKESLPEDSPYYPAREVLEPFLNGEQFISQQNMSPSTYAKHVIGNALSWWPRNIYWYGDGAGPIFLLSNFLWRGFWDFFWRASGWPDLKKAIAKGKSE